MTQQTKTSWVSVGLAGLIVTMLGIAYSAGIITSTGGHEIARVDERIGDVEEDFTVCKVEFNDHQVKNEKDMEAINTHLHMIDLKMTEQTQILKRIERSDQ